MSRGVHRLIASLSSFFFLLSFFDILFSAVFIKQTRWRLRLMPVSAAGELLVSLLTFHLITRHTCVAAHLKTPDE